MRLWNFPSSIPGVFVTGFAISIMAIGHAGCQNFTLLGGPSYDAQGNPLGFLFNTDTSSDVLGGIRLANGQSVFVYGSFKEDGSISEVTGAAIRDVNGDEASVIFEDGRPVKARSFDGSTIDITYEEVTATRLKGHVDLYFADEQVAEDERDQRIEFDVDLLEVAAEVAQRIWDLLGLEISTENPPDDANGRMRLADGAMMPFGKDAPNAQFFLIPLVAPLQYACVTLGFLCVQVMVQLVAVLVSTVLTLVVTLTQVILLAVFSPFFMMCEIMRSAFSLSTAAINFTIELTGPGVHIPACPGC
ncbi:MAG: hypothetical protein JXQ75_08930 [Phycisphaerae bacterium]|nr:hypothetical protein [Phycisphaerae bacterium]